MGTQGTGRKRHPNRERLSAEDHALNQIAREAEARLAAKRAARAEAREIRMKELERQQKEIYQVQKKYYGLDAKWGDIEQWMEDSERYSHRPRRNLQASDEDDLMSVTSRSSLRTNGYEDELLGASQFRKSSRSSTGSGETIQSSQGPPKNEAMNAYYSDLSLASAPLTSKSHQQSVQNGSRPSLLNCNTLPSRSQRGSLYDEGVSSGSRRSSGSRPPSEYSCYLGSGSRASSRASSARASPVSSEPTGPSVFRRGSNSASVASLSHLDDVSIPAMSRVEERPDKDFGDKSSRPVSSLSAATLASLGGTSSRRGSGDTSISVDTEASIREIKEISELKDQIDDVEGRYMQGLKEMKDSLAEVEEKYKRSMVTNAQLDNEKSSLQYQTDMLRDVLMELEEELAEVRRLYDEKHKECERQKHDQTVLRFQLAEMKEALEQREALLTKHGIALDSENTPNGDTSVEPHVNSDGRPDPPIRVTSMGQSEEAVEKKEALSVVCEIPPSRNEQDTQEVLQNTSSEPLLPVEARDTIKEECPKENDCNLKLEPSLNDTCSDSVTGPEHLKAEQPHDSESLNDEKEIFVATSAHGNLNKDDSGGKLPAEDTKAILDQNDISPVEGEDFQDALDVVQPPSASIPLSNEPAFSESDVKTEDCSKSQQEHAIGRVSCKTGESTVDTENKTSEIAEYKNDITADVPVNASDVCAGEEDEHETSSSDSSSKYDSGDDASNETVSTDEEHEKACEEKVDLQKASVDVEQGLQNTGDNPGETNDITDKGSDAVTTSDIHDEEENKIGSVSKQPSQDTPDTKDEKNLLEPEASKSFEISEPSLLSNSESTFDYKEVKKDIDQQEHSEDVTDAESLDTVSEKMEKNEKTENVPPNTADSVLPNQGKEDKPSDLLVECQNPNDKAPSDSESLKMSQREPLISEGESGTEGESPDDDEEEEEDGNDNDDDNGAVRSEKYTGESLPLGSSVDRSSMDDIRMDDGSDNSLKKGKGKNKEDCVVS